MASTVEYWHYNSEARNYSTGRPSPAHVVEAFHKRFFQKDYAPTPLFRLPSSLAKELGVLDIFIKDESSRLGLPAFKILGASWAIFRLLADRFGLGLDTTSLEDLRNAIIANGKGLDLITATDGNHGRAVAHMASILGLRACVYVPSYVSPASRQLILNEGDGVTVTPVSGDYDAAMLAAAHECSRGGLDRALLVQDCAMDEYTTIPSWIVDGYTTLFTEIDQQLAALSLDDDFLDNDKPCLPDLVVVPSGVGSFAHSAVRHYKSISPSLAVVDSAGSCSCQSPPVYTTNSPQILLVEPTAAASVTTSLALGRISHLETGETIMTGLNCPTPSSLSFPDLLKGVDASIAISDDEARQAMEYLVEEGGGSGVDVGPCGAATLSAVRRILCDENKSRLLGLNAQSKIVLISTEGGETYRNEEAERCEWERKDGSMMMPSLDIMDPIELAQVLVRIPSANPSLSPTSTTNSSHHNKTEGPQIGGESLIATYIESWLTRHKFEVHRVEPTPGRPSIVGIARGTGVNNVQGSGGNTKPKNLMFNGHIDTVTLASYEGDPLSGNIDHSAERLYGRGAFDMKAGVAAFLVAAARAKAATIPGGLRGDIIVACVADEEYGSAGTIEVLNAGWLADGAIVTEPTHLQLTLAHRGFVWAEVDVLGVAAHGSRPDLGVDAISKAGHFLVAIEKYAEKLANGPETSKAGMGRGSVHASLIRGGEEPSSYPSKCTIMLERRVVDGETPESVEVELVEILNELEGRVPNFKYSLRMGMARPPFHIAEDNPLVRITESCASNVLVKEVTKGVALFWTDCALLANAGIPSLLFGVDGAGAQAATEYADVQSIRQLTQVLHDVAVEFCR